MVLARAAATMAFRTTSPATSPTERQPPSFERTPRSQPPGRSSREVRANREDIRIDEVVEAVRLSFANVSDRTSFGLGPHSHSTLRNERSPNATTPRLLKQGAERASDNGMLSLVPSIALEKLNAYATTKLPTLARYPHDPQPPAVSSGMCSANEARIAVTFGQREGVIQAYP